MSCEMKRGSGVFSGAGEAPRGDGTVDGDDARIDAGLRDVGIALTGGGTGACL